MNPTVPAPTPSADINGGAPGKWAGPPARPQRVVLYRIFYLAFLGATAAFWWMGGLWPLANAALLATLGVVLGLQALKPSLLPLRIPLGVNDLVNRKGPTSRPYGTPFDRVRRAVIAIFCFYVAASTHAVLMIPVTASSPVSPDAGTVVFADDFQDASSGWGTTSALGLTRAYLVTGYVVTVSGDFDYTLGSPRGKVLQQVATAVTGTFPGDTPLDAGFGVECERGTDASRISYEFVVSADGTWTISRRDGDPSLAPLFLLLKGSSPLKLIDTPNAVEAMCVTLPDGKTTRLIIYVDGAPVADFRETRSSLPDSGWWVGLVVAGSGSAPATLTVKHFEERDLTTRLVIPGAW